MKPVYFDCDGVLLNWEAAFRNWAMDQLGKELPKHTNSWDLHLWLGVTPPRARKLIHDFNHSEQFANIEPMPGAINLVKDLKDTGHRMEVLTSCSRDPAVIRRRRWNLAEHFGDATFSTIECLHLHESKEPILSLMRKGIWIEDNYEGAKAGHHHGHKTYILRHPHNVASEKNSIAGITWINRLDDLMRYTVYSTFV
jgi:beta-phosphoglucomutase-like phosphatase (HAD superfamily)